MSNQNNNVATCITSDDDCSDNLNNAARRNDATSDMPFNVNSINITNDNVSHNEGNVVISNNDNGNSVADEATTSKVTTVSNNSNTETTGTRGADNATGNNDNNNNEGDVSPSSNLRRVINPHTQLNCPSPTLEEISQEREHQVSPSNKSHTPCWNVICARKT